MEDVMRLLPALISFVHERIRIRGMTALLSFAFGLMMLVAGGSHASTVNGRNVASVVYSAGGEPVGIFRQETQGAWAEYTNQQGKAFSFVERGRDDWSVYLYDQSRNVNIQLDLHRKMVRYGQGNGAMSDLYRIVQSEIAEVDTRSQAAPAAATVTNGLNAIQVLFNAGSGQAGAFTMVGEKAWTENNRFSFREGARDEWSTYLYDASRDVSIQLDLHRRKVVYSHGNGPQSDLYDILSFR
jgi:hypothetical protein